jgi:hypothetical protein
MTICPVCRGAKWEDCFAWDWRNGESKWTGSTPCTRCDGRGQIPDIYDSGYFQAGPCDDEPEHGGLPDPIEPTADEIDAMDQWFATFGDLRVA